MQHTPHESSEFGYFDQELQRKGVTSETEANGWVYNWEKILHLFINGSEQDTKGVVDEKIFGYRRLYFWTK